MAEPIRVSGVVREVKRAPVSWTLTCGKYVEHHHDSGELVVEAGGRTLAVSVPGIEIFGEPRRETGGIRDLVARTKHAFDQHGAAPFTEATLASVEFAVGDHVDAWGDVLERDPAGAPQLVRARAIAKGDGAGKRIDRVIAADPEQVAKAAGKTAFGWWLPSLAFVGGAIAWTASRYQPLRGALSLSLIFLAAAVVCRPTPSMSLDFRTREKVAETNEVPTIPVQMVTFMIAIGSLVLAGGAFKISQQLGPLWITDLIGGVLVVLVLLMTVIGKQTQTHIRTVTTGTPWTGGSDQLAVIRGTARARTPVTVNKHALVFGVDIEAHPARQSSTMSGTYRERFVGSTFDLVADAGTIEVAPEELMWTSTLDGQYDVDTKHNTYWYFRAIPEGGTVVAAGWIEKSGNKLKLVSRGTSPAILFGAPAGGDPLVIAQGVLDYWRNTALGMLVVGAALAGLVVAGRAHLL